MTYQSGITAVANSDALFITLQIADQPGAIDHVKRVLSSVPETEALFCKRYPEADLHITAAIGSECWTRVSPVQRPAELTAFSVMHEGNISAPHTPADLLLHIRSERHDLNYEASMLLFSKLGETVELVEQVHGFRYLDNRDLTGFVDGTENPEGDHRAEVAVVGEEDAAFAGGSYIHLQRYEHDLDSWNGIPVKQQEDIIGRTKVDNIEYASAEKPLFSHTKRTSLKDDQGRSVEILRHSMPYGDLTKRGLLFASYGRSPKPFTLMLESMIKGDGHGHTDHLLRYSKAITGQAFFAPSVEWLEQLGR